MVSCPPLVLTVLFTFYIFIPVSGNNQAKRLRSFIQLAIYSELEYSKFINRRKNYEEIHFVMLLKHLNFNSLYSFS